MMNSHLTATRGLTLCSHSVVHIYIIEMFVLNNALGS
jgi:hypothetical protein